MKISKLRSGKALVRIAKAVCTRPIGFFAEYVRFRSMAKHMGDDRFSVPLASLYPWLWDKTLHTMFDRHYIFHTAWAARVLARTRPKSHVDISSSLYFCSIVSAFIPMDFYDYRPADLNLTNLTSRHVDLNSLPFSDGSISSLSCMHVIEHIGLGRYGDPINPIGDLAAASELSRVLSDGGNLLLVVPVGRSKIHFNAHRVYSYEQVKTMFPDLSIVEFSLIRDDSAGGGINANATADDANRQEYGCGLFLFSKSKK